MATTTTAKTAKPVARPPEQPNPTAEEKAAIASLGKREFMDKFALL